MAMERYLDGSVREDLARRMVFVGGPRQVGKTTLARAVLARSPGGLYFNWDRREDRTRARAARWPGGGAVVVLDEIHKWRPWKRWLKGEYDVHGESVKFLVTGSARMDVFRRGGDSLQGRYRNWRLHPFSVAELSRRPVPAAAPGGALEIPVSGAPAELAALLRRGGFPEPLFADTDRVHRRWIRERTGRLFREDVRDLEVVRDLGTMEILADLLPARVGSPLSLNSLRENLEVSHRAVTRWMEILDRLYMVFRLRPFAPKRIRTLRKMTKAYLWDWSEVEAPGPRFENLVASHLLKFCHFLEDGEGHRAELWYLRDRAGREVDFLVTLAGKPWFAVEAKVADEGIDPSLRYFRDALRIPHAYQVVLEGDSDYVQEGIRCVGADRFLAALA